MCTSRRGKDINRLVCVILLAFISQKVAGQCNLEIVCLNGGKCVLNKCICSLGFTGSSCRTPLAQYLGIAHILPAVLFSTNQDKIGSSAVKPNGKVNLACGVSGGTSPYKFRWTLNGKPLNSTADPKVVISSRDGSLVVNAPVSREKYEGNYQCFVSNEYGASLSNVITVKFQVLGTFKSSTTITYNATINEKLKIVCPPHSYSHGAQYRWFNVTSGAQETFDRPRVTMETDGTLIFSYVTDEDITRTSKGLRCTLSFGQSSQSGHTSGIVMISKIADSSRFGIPDLETKSSVGHYFITRGALQLFHCFPTGRPTPNVTWLIGNQEVQRSQSELYATLNNGRTLLITSVAPGVNNFSCRVANQHGSVSRSFILAAPTLGGNKLPKMYASYNKAIILPLGVTGLRSGFPSVTWYYNGKKLESLSSKFLNRARVTSNGSLILTSLKVTDFGVYQCLVNNVAVFSGYELYVMGTPHPPTTLGVTSCSSLNTTLSWKVKSLTGISPTTSFIVEISSEYEPGVFKKLREIRDPNLRKTSINNLSPWANIVFRLRAVNNLGIGFPSVKTSGKLCVTSVGTPSTYPKNLKAVAGPGSGLMNISWTPLPKIEWNSPNCSYGIHYKVFDSKNWRQFVMNTTLRCSEEEYVISGLGSHGLIDIKITATSEKGSGPASPSVRAYAGQNAPSSKPKNIVAYRVTPYEISLRWDPIIIPGGAIDGYLVTYSVMPAPRRTRRAIGRRGSRSMFQSYYQPYSAMALKHRKRRSLQMSLASRIRPALLSLFTTSLYPWKKGREEISTHNVQKVNRRYRRESLRAKQVPKLIRVKGKGVTARGLLPFTNYVFLVRGYTSGGEGPSAVSTVRTINYVDSSYIVTVIVTSENFTAEYEDKKSDKYTRLSATLVKGLQNLLRLRHWFRSAMVVAFRSGSVKAEIQVVAASPIEGPLSVLKEELSRNSFPNYTINPIRTEIKKEMNFQAPFVAVSNPSPHPGGIVQFICTATVGPRSPVFTWLKDGETVMWDLRHKFESKENNQSVLTIRRLIPSDSGNYTCVTSKGNQNSTNSSLLYVRPIIAITPRTVTRKEGESVSFTCRAINSNVTGLLFRIIKYNPNASFEGDAGINTTTYVFRDLKVPTSALSHVIKFHCVIVNPLTPNRPIAVSPIAELTIVKSGVPQCPRETSGGVDWSATAVGKVAINPCPRNATGQVTRKCLQSSPSTARWNEVSFAKCTTPNFLKLALEVDAIISSDFKSSLNTSGLLKTLAGETKTGSNTDTGLYGGDINISVTILTKLNDYNEAKNNTAFDKSNDQERFLEVASNVLQPSNAETWIRVQSEEKDSNKLWRRLVGSLDTFGLQLASRLTNTTKYEIVKENIAMRVDNVEGQSQIYRQGLQFAHEGSSIFLPKEVFSGSQNSQVVSLVYKTLNTVMRLHEGSANSTNTSSSEPLPSNTTVVTSTVRPEPLAFNSGVVKIVVKNKKVVDPVPPRTCVYWRNGIPNVWQTHGCRLVTSESDKHVTTCECNHLTVFASLMDPYGGPLPKEHQKALELISTIGCSISLLAVLLTIVITVFFWRTVKGPRSIVLLNICIAIAAVCILVIAEGTARNTKVGCTVLAVLLHYFLLAVFCWMLCEAALLYILIIKVIGGRAEEKVKYFFLFGWGLPAVIVGISLAATQTKGYGYHGQHTSCWLAVDNGLIWAFVAPAVVVIMINIIVLIFVIRQTMSTRHVQAKSRDEKVRIGIKATAVILPVLGVTWVFGLLAFSSDTIAFKYIFAILNSLQGLMIFIFHCLLSKQIQDAFRRKYRQLGSSDSYGAGTNSKQQKQPRKKDRNKETSIGPKKKAKNQYEMSPKGTAAKQEQVPNSEPTSPPKSAVYGDDVVVHEPTRPIGEDDYESQILKSAKFRDGPKNRGGKSTGYPLYSEIGEPPNGNNEWGKPKEASKTNEMHLTSGGGPTNPSVAPQNEERIHRFVPELGVRNYALDEEEGEEKKIGSDHKGSDSSNSKRSNTVRNPTEDPQERNELKTDLTSDRSLDPKSDSHRVHLRLSQSHSYDSLNSGIQDCEHEYQEIENQMQSSDTDEGDENRRLDERRNKYYVATETNMSVGGRQRAVKEIQNETRVPNGTSSVFDYGRPLYTLSVTPETRLETPALERQASLAKEDDEALSIASENAHITSSNPEGFETEQEGGEQDDESSTETEESDTKYEYNMARKESVVSTTTVDSSSSEHEYTLVFSDEMDALEASVDGEVIFLSQKSLAEILS